MKEDDSGNGKIVITQSNNQRVGDDSEPALTSGARGFKWVLSVFFGLLSLGLLFSEPISAFFAFLVFLMWLPPFDDYLDEKKWRLPTLAKVLATFLFVFLLMVAL